MRTLLALLMLCLLPAGAMAQDADGDGLTDALEAGLGMDPRLADRFDLIHDDKAKADGDKSLGSALDLAGDFTRIWFCPAAKDRYVWKIEFAAPWVSRSDVATILYVDADNDRATGRHDSAWAQGVDVMLRPDGATLYGWAGAVKTTSAVEGGALYLVADIALAQKEGKSSYRCWLLTQNTAPGHERDTDNMAPIQVSAAGRIQRPRPALPPSHPLYLPPETLSDVGVRMVPGAPRPTAEVTWITSWPCKARVEFGIAGKTGESAEQPVVAQNHRVFLPVKAGSTYRVQVTCTDSEGAPRRSKGVTFRATDPTPVGKVQRSTLTLSPVAHREGDSLTPAAGPGPFANAPFLAGVPFPRGALGSVENLRVLRGGKELPAQAECAARWPDGTVRWALVQAFGSTGTAPLALEYGSGVRATLRPPAPMLSQTAGRIECNTGPLKAVVDTESFGLFRELSLDRDGDGAFSAGEQIINGQARGGLYLVDAAGKEYLSAKPEEVAVEENGPVRAVVKVRGHHLAQDGSRLFEYTVRLLFTRGQEFIRIFHTFGNDNVGRQMTDIAQMGIRLPLAVGGAAEVNGRRGAVELRQMRYDQPAPVPDTLLVSEGDRHLAAHLVDLRAQYPKAWRFGGGVLDLQLCPRLEGKEYADADPVTSDRLYFYLRDGVTRLRAGVSKTHEIRLWLPARRPDAEDLQALAAYRPEAQVVAPPAWVAQSGAAGPMTVRAPDEFAEYESFVGRSLDAFQKLRDRQGEYGMLNYGDWWGERAYNWGNVEYDTQNVMLMEFLRTRDPRFLSRGCEAAVHNRDVDGIHYAPSPGDVGQVHVHAMFHTGGYEVRTPDKGLAFPGAGFNRGHVWTRGTFAHYFLTGDRRSLEWALAVSDYLAGQLTIGFSVGHHAERDTAWPLFGVLAAYEATADPYYLNAARIMVEDVIRRQIPETGNWGFPAGYSKAVPLPVGGYAWCCGLLISALDQYNDTARDRRVNQVIVRAARWLVRDEWMPEKQGFRATSCPTFNAFTRPGEASWSCANAMLIAHRLTGDPQFLEIARRGFSLYLRGTQAMGKSVTQSICLGPQTLWRLKRAGVTSLDSTPYLPAGSVSVPRTLVLWPGDKVALRVLLRGSREGKTAAEVRVGAGAGVAVSPASRSIELAARGQEAAATFEVLGSLQPGETRSLAVEWNLGGTAGKQGVKVVRPLPVAPGSKVGLIASGEDFLGPALDRLGVAYQRLKSLDEIGEYRVLLLGTQAHSIDSAGLHEGYWRLFPWIHAGGTLFLSQLNDTGWESGFLPYPVVVDDTDGESGAVVDPSHPLFTRPRKVASAPGVTMYDTLRLAPGDPWKVLLRDSTGGPAIAEAVLGKGRILLMQPSFERLSTGEAGWLLFENLVRYVLGSDQ